MLNATNLAGLSQVEQLGRISGAVQRAELTPSQAVALAAEIGLPEEMRSQLATSSVVVVGYAGLGLGGSSGHKPLPPTSPLLINHTGVALNEICAGAVDCTTSCTVVECVSAELVVSVPVIVSV